MKRCLIFILLLSQMLGSMPLASYLEEVESVKYEKEITKDFDEETKIIQQIKGDFSKKLVFFTNVEARHPKINYFSKGLFSSLLSFGGKELLRWLCIFRI